MDSKTESATATATKRPIGITTTYIIHGGDGTARKTSETFDSSRSEASEVRLGLPIDMKPVKVRFEELCCRLDTRCCCAFQGTMRQRGTRCLYYC